MLSKKSVWSAKTGFVSQLWHSFHACTLGRSSAKSASSIIAAKLLVHCCRMLGLVTDAGDAVQETLLRAWRYRDSVKKARRCAHGSTEWLRTPASKVSLWCGSKHRPKHFNEGTYTVVADCDSDLRDRFALCQHLKGSKQPRLLSPTAK
jgi:hypothetical protein